MYAVIRTGGKQYRVEEGDVIAVEKLGVPVGERVDLEDVLLTTDDEGNTNVGCPVVEGAKVQCKIVADAKGPKIVVYKRKRRKDSDKKTGHRQALTMLRICNIEAPKA